MAHNEQASSTLETANPRRAVVHVIGSVHLDFVTTTPRCPGPGETIQASRFDVNAGGKGANQAAACGRAASISKGETDMTIEMIGAVGADDPYYEKISKTLQESRVSTVGIAKVAGTSTGTATIIVEEGSGGENRILFVPGAGFEGMMDAYKVMKRGEFSPDVVVLQGEIPRDTVLEILKHYNGSENTEIVFNPAPVWSAGVPAEALRGLAILVVNENECLLLAKTLAAEGHDITTVENEGDLSQAVLENMATKFHTTLEVRNLIVTLGSKGAFYSQATGSKGTIASVKVDKVVDTTGAGDTFVGYVTAEFARWCARGRAGEFDLAAACKIANSAAAICVTRAGAMQSMPFRYELS